MPKSDLSSGQNPLLRGLKIPVQRRQRFRSANMAGGGSVRMVSDTRVDVEPYIKVYVPMLDLIAKMSDPGRKVLSAVMRKLEPHSDVVVLTLREFVEITGVNSASTMSKGVDNLEELGVICRTGRRGRYYINPCLFFNGSRLKMLEHG